VPWRTPYDALVAISAKKPAKIHFVIPIPPLGFVVRITQPRRESDIEQICRTKGGSGWRNKNSNRA
jgi:hypothetical protein